ncbi:dynein light intermediate chain 2, cytosolic [Strigomonas culicis]|uniref:Dynein light intermediate chain 2, cytosolic n=1 Tax=Strigomonas culicis TaxID=28005 RepID=S9U4V9_9TRYP|nr:dynein light intermediate chain 2, cytosolic [Strigomonas culicis]|eukprot:EPY23978.1 dynein light intermediate chain 2, cytosolic [Strigomonas culicis]
MSPDVIHALVVGVVVDVGPEAWVCNQGFYLNTNANTAPTATGRGRPSITSPNNRSLSGTVAVHPAVAAWDTAVYWLQRTDARAHELFERMRAKGSKTPEKLQQRALRQVGGADHPDVKRMRLSGVPTVLVVNKMDLFHDNTTKAKQLAKCFRYLAHVFGAHLVFTSDADSLKFKLLMHHVLFQSPLDAKLLNEDCERDTVLLTADRDTFVDIGEPTGGGKLGGGGSSYASGDVDLDRWRAYLEGCFPPPTEEERQALLNANANATSASAGTAAGANAAVINKAFLPQLYVQGEGGYGEPVIDALRRQKDEELEQYRRANKGKRDKKETKG